MSELSTLNMDDDLEEAASAAEPGSRRLERKGDLEIWVTLSPEGHEDESFTARLAWEDYPGDWPPSVLFVDPSTGRSDVPTAWPTGPSFRPPVDICATWTFEGYVTHPEWKGDRSKRLVIGDNAVLQFARILQHELDCNFTGRHR